METCEKDYWYILIAPAPAKYEIFCLNFFTALIVGLFSSVCGSLKLASRSRTRGRRLGCLRLAPICQIWLPVEGLCVLHYGLGAILFSSQHQLLHQNHYLGNKQQIQLIFLEMCAICENAEERYFAWEQKHSIWPLSFTEMHCESLQCTVSHCSALWVTVCEQNRFSHPI